MVLILLSKIEEIDTFKSTNLHHNAVKVGSPVKQLSLKQLPFKKANSKTANSKSANFKTATL